MSADMVKMVDAAMVEMREIHPPLRRSECERLIRAALAQPAACQLPPAGWACTRAPGHDGPCAAVPACTGCDPAEGFCAACRANEQRQLAAAPEDRALVLLRAARDLLKKQQNSLYTLDLLDQTVFYDGAECDGSCLLDDIETELSTNGGLTHD